MSADTRRMLWVLAALSVVLHLGRLGEPASVLFDEVHFGRFVSSYSGRGTYFFDIHPPHGKLLIAGVAWIGGYRGEQDFEKIHEPIDRVSPALIRLWPALAGTMIPLVAFGLLLRLGATPAAALLAGLALLLDNALLLQTRVIALDGTLVLATLASLWAVVSALSCRSRLRRSGRLLIAGALAGLAAGTKLTGLLSLGLIGVCLLADAPRRSTTLAGRVRVLAGHSAWALTGFVSVYLIGWALHFSLLDAPPPDFKWGGLSGRFIEDLVSVHRRMLTANYGLITHHPYSSPWWSWPLMMRPVFYWSGVGGPIYFLGNPVVWWGATLLLVASVVGTSLHHLTGARSGSPRSGEPCAYRLSLVGFVASLAPLTVVPRPLFLYHYLTPLVFSSIAGLLWLDRLGWTRPGGFDDQRTSYHVTLILLGIGFLAIAPFTFSFVSWPEYTAFLQDRIPSWR